MASGNPPNINITGLSQSAQVLLHELLHAAVDEAKLQKAIGKDAEEHIVEQFALKIIPDMVAIANILQNAQLTDLDLRRLHVHVESIRTKIENLRQTWGDQAVDDFLSALGWTDADHNGLPDWLDQYLRDHGFDPDNMPYPDPPGGDGGGGDPEPDDGPIGDPDHPTLQPIQNPHPIDPPQ